MLVAINGNSFVFKQTIRSNLKTSQNVISKSGEADEEILNTTKYMVGATALAAVVESSVVACKGKPSKGIQNFLGEAGKDISSAFKDDSVVSKDMVSNELDVLIAKKNKEMQTLGIDGKVFRDQNNPEHVIEIKKNGKNDYSKCVYSVTDFFNGNLFELNSIEKTCCFQQGLYEKYVKKYTNKVQKTITRMPYNSQGKLVETEIKPQRYGCRYEKRVEYNKDGKVMHAKEKVYLPPIINIAESEPSNFKDYKKLAFADFREGLNWQE